MEMVGTNVALATEDLLMTTGLSHTNETPDDSTIYRRIPDFNCYQINKTGTTLVSHVFVEPKILKPRFCCNTTPSYRISRSADFKSFDFTVARLVVAAFTGSTEALYKKKEVFVIHKDLNVCNNHFDNLEVVDSVGFSLYRSELSRRIHHEGAAGYLCFKLKQKDGDWFYLGSLRETIQYLSSKTTYSKRSIYQYLSNLNEGEEGKIGNVQVCKCPNDSVKRKPFEYLQSIWLESRIDKTRKEFSTIRQASCYLAEVYPKFGEVYFYGKLRLRNAKIFDFDVYYIKKNDIDPLLIPEPIIVSRPDIVLPDSVDSAKDSFDLKGGDSIEALIIGQGEEKYFDSLSELKVYLQSKYPDKTDLDSLIANREDEIYDYNVIYSDLDSYSFKKGQVSVVEENNINNVAEETEKGQVSVVEENNINNATEEKEEEVVKLGAEIQVEMEPQQDKHAVTDNDLIVVINNDTFEACCLKAMQVPDYIMKKRYSGKDFWTLTKDVSDKKRDIDNCTLVYLGPVSLVPEFVIQYDDKKEKQFYSRLPLDKAVEEIYKIDPSVSKITIRSQLKRNFKKIGKCTLLYPYEEQCLKNELLCKKAVINLDTLNFVIVRTKNALIHALTQRGIEIPPDYPFYGEIGNVLVVDLPK